MFNFRDLMVNLSQIQPGIGTLTLCGFSCHICTRTCYDTCAYSYGCEITITRTVAVQQAVDPELSAQQLGTVKAQLQQALAEIEKQEKAKAK